MSDLDRLFTHRLSISTCKLQGGGDFPAHKTCRENLRLDGNRCVFERCLARAELRNRQIAGRCVLSDEDRINGRQSRRQGIDVRKIRSHAVRQQQHTRKRLSAETVTERVERVAKRGGAILELQLGKVRGRLQPCTHQVITGVELLLEFVPPLRLLPTQKPENGFTAGLCFPLSLKLETRAVIRDHGEHIRTRLDALTAPGRFEQA
ncbi:MAG: hypothetical protein EOP83_26120 [Verrucomicrobiaceae bacterium]|nr:MAG: hypothetical protein EOP83_26120 [Verrucomicrobiaceae bacterium]